MVEIGGLPLGPGRLRPLQRLCAFVDDRGDAIFEADANLLQQLVGVAVVLIFDGVVEEGRDRLVLVAPVLEDERTDTEQVGDVRRGRAFFRLVGVQLGRIDQGIPEALIEYQSHPLAYACSQYSSTKTTP